MILDVHAELLSMSLQHTVAKEIEALIPGVPHRGFRLVERQPELRHHRLRPRQGLLRAAAAEDDEVVGVRDDVSPERFAASGLPGLTGRTTLSDSRTVRCQTHSVGSRDLRPRGSPPITRITLPTCRSHYPDGSERGHLSIASPSNPASPV